MDAIEKLKEMFKTHKDPSFWSYNMIEASKLCTSEMDWKHFYAFATNPHKYNPDAVQAMKTIGDLPESEVTDCIKPLPEHMVPHVFENGTETIIHTRNETPDEKIQETDSDDEKLQ